MNDSKPKLTPKQQMFVKEYLIDLNATQAAIRAGYSAKTANEQGARLLTNVSVQQSLQEAMVKRSERTEITVDMVVQILLKQADSDIKNFIEWVEEEIIETEEMKDGMPVIVRTILPKVRLKPMDKVDGTLITEIQQTKDGIKFKRPDPQKAVELLGRHLAMFTDKQEIRIDRTEEDQQQALNMLKELRDKKTCESLEREGK